MRRKHNQHPLSLPYFVMGILLGLQLVTLGVSAWMVHHLPTTTVTVRVSCQATPR